MITSAEFVTESKKLTVLTALDCQGLAHKVANLKNVSIKIFASYRSIRHEGKGNQSVMWTEEDESDHNSQNAELETYLVTKKKTTK